MTYRVIITPAAERSQDSLSLYPQPGTPCGARMDPARAPEREKPCAPPGALPLGSRERIV